MNILDAQVSLNIPRQYLVFKVGASNVLNNKQFQTYGGQELAGWPTRH